jgi:hypothetical protein
MSDRTSMSVTVADCPPAQIEALTWTLIDLGLSKVDDHNEFTADEIICGTAHDVGERLPDAAPGASWELVEQPAYEYLGIAMMYTPALGLFTADCNDLGQPLVTTTAALALAEIVRQNPDAISEIRGRLGFDHRRALDDLIERNTESVLPEPGSQEV